jgi:hypothetical protein
VVMAAKTPNAGLRREVGPLQLTLCSGGDPGLFARSFRPGSVVGTLPHVVQRRTYKPEIRRWPDKEGPVGNGLAIPELARLARAPLAVQHRHPGSRGSRQVRTDTGARTRLQSTPIRPDGDHCFAHARCPGWTRHEDVKGGASGSRCRCPISVTAGLRSSVVFE